MIKKLLFLAVTATCATFSMNAQNLLATYNAGFEGIKSPPAGTSPYDWWGIYNETTVAATLTDETTATNIHGGAHGAKVVVGAVDASSSNWKPQLANGKTLTLVVGHSYTVTFWIKGVNGIGKVQASNNGTSLYGPILSVTTAWQQYSQTFTATAANYQIWISMGGFIETYYVDDASLIDNTALGVNDFNTENNKALFYPNPVTNNLNINSEEEIKSVIISDLTGKTVRTVTNAENIQAINLSDLNQGLYILSTDTNKQFKFIKK